MLLVRIEAGRSRKVGHAEPQNLVGWFGESWVARGSGSTANGLTRFITSIAVEMIGPPRQASGGPPHCVEARLYQRVLRAFALGQQRECFTGDVGLEMWALLMGLERGFVAEQFVKQELRRIVLAPSD